MKELTERQREVLMFIKVYIHTHAYPPTIREIAENFLVSVKGAHDHVGALKKKGYIKGDKRSRTMELVKRDDEDNEEDILIPLLGPVAAGTPILAEENWERTIPLHSSLLRRGSEYFALRVRGDSMIGAGIMDGDIAIIEQQSTAEDGEVVVAMVNEAMTLKRFFKEKNRVRLQPENEKYKPIYSQDVQLLGRISKILRDY
jgi:repressor LexA